MLTDREMLLRAVLAQATETLPRLVFADWL
jgi:uncharacterized protein (TIGR02996 family)